MAKHRVRMMQPTVEVHNKDVEFEVFADDAKLGTLMISQGGVEWKTRYAETASLGMSWEEFIRTLEG